MPLLPVGFSCLLVAAGPSPLAELLLVPTLSKLPLCRIPAAEQWEFDLI